MFNEKQFEKEVARLLPFHVTFAVDEIIEKEFYNQSPKDWMVDETWRELSVYAKGLKVEQMYIDEIDNLAGDRFLTEVKVRGNGAFFAVEIYDSEKEK